MSENAYVNFESGNVARKAAVAAASFLATATAATIAKEALENGVLTTFLLMLAVAASLFLTMHVAKPFIRQYFRRHWWVVVPSALAAVLLVSSVKPAVFAGLFVLHAAACFFLRTLKNTARVGVEMILLITVLGSFAYGPKEGALLGGAAMLMDYALSARFSYFVPITTGAYMLIGLFAGSFASSGITAVGIWAAVIYNLATSFVILAFMGGHIDKCLRFGISNVALNFMLFTSVAQWLLAIIT